MKPIEVTESEVVFGPRNISKLMPPYSEIPVRPTMPATDHSLLEAYCKITGKRWPDCDCGWCERGPSGYRKKRIVPEPDYAFCEGSTASGSTPWHIRKLTDKGPRYGGGADTPALCGRGVAWDVQVGLTEHHLSHACKTCVEVYRDARD